MRRNKKKSRQLALLLILLGITVGFALLSTTLKINGTAGIKSNQWDIHWENVQVNNESTVTADTPVIDGNRTKVTYEVNLELPGDFYEFTVDAKNDGSINGKITDIKHNVYLSTDTEHENPVTLPSYILYTLYYDGTTTPPAPDDILEAGEKQTYRVRVEYDSQATTIPSTDTTYVVVDEITYTQTKDSDTPPEPEDTSIPGLWFYEINNDGEHTASIVAVNSQYDEGMTAMTNYENKAGTESVDNQDYWDDTAGDNVPYVNHAPDYFKNIVMPSKVKLDAEGKYDPENGTEYTITRFYDSYGTSQYDESTAVVSQAKYDYINNNHGIDIWSKCYAIESIVFPNTYLSIDVGSGGGWYNLSSVTLSNNLTNLPHFGGSTDYSESLDPRVELHLPATVTRTPSNGFCSNKVKTIYAPESLRSLLTNVVETTEWCPTQLVFE